MKRFIRCSALLLVLSLLFSVPVFATENVESRASSFFACSSVYLTKTSENTFDIHFDVTALRTMDKLGAYEIEVQISEDGESWATTQTYSYTSYPQFMDTNTIHHGWEFSYHGSRNFYYRAIITLYAKDSTGAGYSDRYTSTLKL